jgi:hypothetical protein
MATKTVDVAEGAPAAPNKLGPGPSDVIYTAAIPREVLGAGQHRYRALDRFFKRPRFWTFVEVPDVAVDKDDNVYLYTENRDHTMMIFDKRGNFIHGWGDISDLYFSFPHGLCVGPDGSVYTTDIGNHTVKKWTPEGKLLLTLGTGQNSGFDSGKPFNMPTKVAVASNGDIYVSDGYGNSYIHVFDESGQFKFSWGGRGGDKGQFDLPHGVFVDRDDGDKVYVIDRFNNRVQIFSPSGDYIDEWGDVLLPCAIAKAPDGSFVVAELYQRVTVLSPQGKVLARWGDENLELIDDEGSRKYYKRGLPDSPARKLEAEGAFKGIVRAEPGPGKFTCPHGVTVDSEGSIYLSETPEARQGLDRGDRSIQKFVRA